MSKKIASITLGCAKNQVDTEFMLGTLMASDYLLVSKPELADIVVINTCCFIDAAKEETVNAILNIVNLKLTMPDLKMIVVGCAAQKYGRELLKEIPEIDGLIGTGQPGRLKDVLEAFELEKSGPYIAIDEFPLEQEPNSLRWEFSRHSAYLKIAEGCDNNCTYCIIPQIRGPYRSRELNALIDEARQLVNQGVRELCLVAQDVTAYGLDLYGELRLPQLLKELAMIEDLAWIRLLYCYPTQLTDELLLTIRQEPKVCRYLDIPLQHGDSTILRRMGRKGDRQFLDETLARVRAVIPDITLRTTFIVGFPGEKEPQFQKLLDFIKKQRFQWVGVFTYSREQDTGAGKMQEQVCDEIKEERYHRAMLLQREITLELNEQWVGQILPVIIDNLSQEGTNTYVGRTQFQAPEVDGVVLFTTSISCKPGDIVQVRITAIDEYDLIGEMAE